MPAPVRPALAAALAAALLPAAGPARAGVAEAVTDHALPAVAAFRDGTEALAEAARADCRAEALRPAYQDAFDAWMGMSHLTLGPLEDGGRRLAIALWPDTRGLTQGAVAGLLADEDPAVDDPATFAEVSVAGRGLFALERLIYGEGADYGADAYACRLARAVAVDLARTADAIDDEWRADFAPALLDAGSPGDTRFLSDREALQALWTAFATGLEFDADQRLGRPLGTFERPRPERAEARRSGRSLRNVVLSLEALRDMARALADGPIPLTEDAFETAILSAEDLDDPVFADVADVQGRFEAEILEQKIDAVRTVSANEIGTALGVSAGFNSADGD